jgi:hypothetical protein
MRAAISVDFADIEEPDTGRGCERRQGTTNWQGSVLGDISTGKLQGGQEMRR